MKPDLFRVSFDQPITPRDMHRGRAAAVLLSVCGAGVILSGVWALLNASSETIGEFTNAKPDQSVRVLGTAVESGKPCEDQTWPYLEARCLKQADSQSAGRSTPKHGLGSGKVGLPGAPIATDKGAEVTPAPASVTTGAAGDDANVTTRASAPGAGPSARSSAPASPPPGTAAARQPGDAKPGRSAHETRRQERARLQRERREAVRKERDRRLRARAEAREFQQQTRPDRNDNQAWTQHSYRSRDGSSHRVIVIRRGMLDDDFF